MEMICPEDKFAALVVCLREWSASRALSLADIERAVGIMYWLSAGFEIGRAEIAHLVHMRTSGQSIQRRTGRGSVAILVKVTRPASASLKFWCEEFSTWNRRTPIKLHYGPCGDWQVMGRVDASTDWGWGGVMVARGARSLPWFNEPWTEQDDKDAMVTLRPSTGLLELRGVRRWLEVFGPACHGLRVLVESDNSAAVYDIEAAYSKRPGMMGEIVAIRRLCIRFHIVLRVRHILGVVFNRVADALSHNRISLARCLAEEEFGCVLDHHASSPQC